MILNNQHQFRCWFSIFVSFVEICVQYFYWLLLYLFYWLLLYLNQSFLVHRDKNVQEMEFVAKCGCHDKRKVAASHGKVKAYFHWHKLWFSFSCPLFPLFHLHGEHGSVGEYKCITGSNPAPRHPTWAPVYSQAICHLHHRYHQIQIHKYKYTKV